MEGKTKLNNRLWQARRRSGLGQKQVARLLGHKTTDQISRYERGTRTPSFKTALKLSIIYQTPITMLFPEHFHQYQTEISEKLEQITLSLPEETKTLSFVNNQEVCSYLDFLTIANPSQYSVDKARKHAIRLHETISDVIERTRKSNQAAD